jgi:hypothetical protein
MRQSNSQSVKKKPELSDNNISTLMMIIGQKDGVTYTSFTWLNFSRPAVCLKSDKGEQKVIAIENAKQILSEETSND